MFKLNLFLSSKGRREGNIYECFRWIYRVGFFSGCLNFRVHKGQVHRSSWHKFYTTIIPIALLVGFFGGISIKVGDAESSRAMFGHLSPVLCFILVFESTLSTIIYMVVYKIMNSQADKHMDLAKKFQQLDRRMQDVFPRVNWNYYKTTRKYTPLTTIVVGIYTIISLVYVFNMAHCSCNFMSTITIAASYACITVGPACVGFLHVGLMDFLRIRYRLCWKLFDQHFNMAKNQCNATVAFAGDDAKHYLEPKVIILIGSFQHYTALILHINEVFSYVCAAGIFYDFGILTSMVFLLCQKATEAETTTKEYIFMLVLLTLRVYKTMMTTAYGFLVARERATCVHKIILCEQYFPKSASIRAAMSQFLDWQRHNKYDLTIGQSIKANVMVFYMLLNGIANYVIILIQLQFQQMNIKNQLKMMVETIK